MQEGGVRTPFLGRLAVHNVVTSSPDSRRQLPQNTHRKDHRNDNVIDWILDLFRDPVQARAFVDDPDRSHGRPPACRTSPPPRCNAVAASVAPAAVIHGGGDPVHGLQQAVAETHGIAFTPHRVLFARDRGVQQQRHAEPQRVPQQQRSPLLSPEAGQSVQQGGVNLDFGDITFGDRQRTPPSDGSVINTGNAGDIDATNVERRQLVGDDNDVNTGDIEDRQPLAGDRGNDNEIDDNSHQTAGGDIIQATRDRSSRPATSTPAAATAPAASVATAAASSPVAAATAATRPAAAVAAVASSQRTPRPPNTDGGDVTTVGDTDGGDISGGIHASHDDNSSNSHNSDNSTQDSHGQLDNSGQVNTDVHQDVDAGLF